MPVSTSFLRALASSFEGNDCRIVAISTDSIEAHRSGKYCIVDPFIYLFVHFREFSVASLKNLTIPLAEDKTGDISRAFEVFDSTTHTAVPTAFIMDEEGELMASFSTSTMVRDWGNVGNLKHF